MINFGIIDRFFDLLFPVSAVIIVIIFVCIGFSIVWNMWMYKFCNVETDGLDVLKRKLDNADWDVNAQNRKRIYEKMSEVLGRNGIRFDDSIHIEFVSDSEVLLSSDYGEGQVRVSGLEIPEDLKERIEIYKEW